MKLFKEKAEAKAYRRFSAQKNAKLTPATRLLEIVDYVLLPKPSQEPVAATKKEKKR